MRKFKVLSIFIAVVMLAGIAFAETPSTLKPTVWKAENTFKFKVNFDGTVDFDGAANFDGAVDFDSTVDLSGATLTFSTGQITAANILDITRSFTIPLEALHIANSTIIGADGTTAPGIAQTDAVMKAVWASGEATSLMYNFTVPVDYVSGLSFRLMASTDADTASGSASWGFDWVLFVNNPDTAFDATAYSQDAVGTYSNTAPSTKNSVFTLTADATAAADIAAGDVVTIGIFPYDVRLGGASGGTTELMAIQVRYTATQ